MIDWSTIDTVLLDMDGTLLDLHFDNYFWLQHLPLRYAEHHGRPLEEVRNELVRRFEREQGTLNWYCLDYWTRELGLNIRQLKEEVQHLIAFRPHVQDFLAELQQSHHRLILVTNAHRQSLSLKLAMTGLDRYFDRLVSSHDFGLPKENPAFWAKLQELEPFDPQRTLVIDDSPSVLRAAREFGIRHILTILQPDSRGEPREIREFVGLDSFERIRLGGRPAPAQDEPAGNVRETGETQQPSTQARAGRQ